MNSSYFIDIHCHPTMRVYHNRQQYELANYWEENKNQQIDNKVGRWASRTSSKISKVSQSNFYNCINGNVRVVFDSLYPVERGFVKFRKLPQKILGEKNIESLVVNSAGISIEQFNHYKASDNYYNDLKEQYDFLISNQGPSPCERFQYKVVNDFNEMVQWVDQSVNHLAVILTIEGVHSFGYGPNTASHMKDHKLKEFMVNNIREVKKWEYPPFFVTFAHHFWNQLCGHAPSLALSTKVTCNQNEGINTGFNSIGMEVLEELLSNTNGKRILIDTRHMSAKSRIEYFEYVKKHNNEYPNDKIPIISSHSAVNGFETLQDSVDKKDTVFKKKKTPYCAWSINISSEEVRAVHESNGIIGVILDKGRHSGLLLLKNIESIPNEDNRKKAFIKLILDNLFFFIEAVNKRSAWDILSLGSDFDGVITHFDDYKDMSTIPDLKKNLINYLNEYQYKKELWFGYSPEAIFEKIFHTNAFLFLKKHFK